MSVPRYLIEQKAKEFDEIVLRAHRRYRDPYADQIPNIGLQLIADEYAPLVRDMRVGDKVGKKKK